MLVLTHSTRIYAITSGSRLVRLNIDVTEVTFSLRVSLLSLNRRKKFVTAGLSISPSFHAAGNTPAHPVPYQRTQRRLLTPPEVQRSHFQSACSLFGSFHQFSWFSRKADPAHRHICEISLDRLSVDWALWNVTLRFAFHPIHQQSLNQSILSKFRGVETTELLLPVNIGRSHPFGVLWQAEFPNAPPCLLTVSEGACEGESPSGPQARKGVAL